MSKPNFEAQIIEIETENGPYFNVTLYAVPRVGELIHIYSLEDAAAHYPPEKHYEVVQVSHKLYDIPKNITANSPQAAIAGSHFVTVFVKRSTSGFFDRVA